MIMKLQMFLNTMAYLDMCSESTNKQNRGDWRMSNSVLNQM